MPLIRPSLAELSATTNADLSTRIGSATPGQRRSLLGALGAALVGALHGLYGALIERSKQHVPTTATATDLERWAGLWGVARKQPTQADGAATATGASGVLIPADTRLQSAAGVAYTVDADVTTAGGTASLAITAVDAGANGNQPAGAVLSWVNPPSGLAATVTVGPDGLGGGADLETDDGLRARLEQRIQAPGHGGNAEDYRSWALSVGPITRAWVFPLYSGAGTVRIYVANDAYVGATLASAGDVSDVQAYLDSVKPVTATVTAVAPTATPVDYTLSITPDNAETRAAVQAALAALYLREAVPEGAISLNRMIVAIGSSGLDDFAMTVPAAEPDAAAGCILTLGAITWV